MAEKIADFPTASVVILSWNTLDLTLECIRSLKSSCGDFPVEVIVVDNGSSDGSPGAISEHHPDVLLIRLQTNLGFAAGANVGLRVAKGKYLVLLNSDTVVLPGAVQELTSYLDCQPTVGAAGGRRRTTHGGFVPGGHRFPCVWHDLALAVGLQHVGVGVMRRWPTLGGVFYTTGTTDVDWVAGAFVAVRRAALADAGLLPEEFFFYGEDLEWCWRIKQKGWVIAYVHGEGVIHHEGRSADQLYGVERGFRVLDGLYVFGVRHRHPVGWRVGWLGRSAFLGGRAAWTLLRVWNEPEKRAEAHELARFARRHVDQVLGRYPWPLLPDQRGTGSEYAAGLQPCLRQQPGAGGPAG